MFRHLLAVAFLLAGSLPAFAQAQVMLNWQKGTTGNAPVQASAANPLPVTPIAGGTPQNVNPTPTAIAYTDRSGTLTTGGVAQNAMAANAARHGVWFQNVSSGNLYINSVTTASPAVSAGSGSLLVSPGAYWEAPDNGVPSGALSVYGATTAQAWIAREW